MVLREALAIGLAQMLSEPVRTSPEDALMSAAGGSSPVTVKPMTGQAPVAVSGMVPGAAVMTSKAACKKYDPIVQGGRCKGCGAGIRDHEGAA